MWNWVNVSYSDGKRTLACKASTCEYEIHDNISLFETHVRECEKAKREFPNMLLSIGGGQPASCGVEGSSPGGAIHLGPVSPDELSNWQLQCAQLMLEDGSLFSSFDSGK